MSEPIKILALDLATTMGWAIGSTDGSKPRFGLERLGKRGDEPASIGMAFTIWFHDMMRVDRVDAIYVERAMHPAIAAKIGSNADTNMILVGLVFMAVSLARMMQIRTIRLVDAQEVKKHFTGQGRFKDEYDPAEGKIIKSREVGKRATMARCRQLGIPVTDDNQADAVALWFYGSGQHDASFSSRVTPLFAGEGR